jgi:hypothetical protein
VLSFVICIPPLLGWNDKTSFSQTDKRSNMTNYSNLNISGMATTGGLTCNMTPPIATRFKMEAVHNNTSIASHMLHHISPNGQKVSTSKDAEKGITNIPRSMSEQASDTIYVFVFVRNFLVVITAIITKLFPAKTTILIMVKVNVVCNI